MEFKNKKILVCGMATSGISVAIFLNSIGANVTIQDIKKIDSFKNEDIKKLKDKKIILYLGKNPDEIIKDFDIIVLSPGIPTTLGFLETARKNNIPIIGEIEVGYMFNKGEIYSITGTNGKTTTTSLVGEIINKYNNSAKVLGNIGASFTSEINNIKENNIVVLEVSSFQLETVNKFHPKISCVLNISEDHLDRHITMENYIKCKENIFKNQTDKDYIILNYDDERCKLMALKTNAKKVYFSRHTFLEQGIYLKDDYIYINDFGINEKFINIHDLKILGLHNIENVMAAIGICLSGNIPKENILKGVKEFKGVSHRLEYVTSINNIEFYNDSKATNPESSINAIKSIKRPIVLIAGGYEKNTDFTELIKYFKGRVKHVIVLGEVKKRFIKDLEKNSFNSYTDVTTFEEGVLKSFDVSEDGDCILLSPACASWGMFENFEQRGELFKKIVFSLRG